MNQTLAIIGTVIAATGILAGGLGLVWKSLDQRFDDLGTRINERFNDQEKLFDAKLETVRVEIRELDKRLTTPTIIQGTR